MRPDSHHRLLSLLRALMLVPVLLLGACAPASAQDPLDAWRSEAARIRVLAENNAPRAYEQAMRLHAALPSTAPPADRARSLNLLSRIETYLALTEPAAAHAREAFDLSTRHGDRVGQVESDLNVALNAINQGRLDEMVRASQDSVTASAGLDRPELVAEAMLRVAVMYRRFEELEQSVAVAVDAMEVARRSGNARALTYANQGMAIAFEQSDRLDEAQRHYQAMREHARAGQSRLLEAFAVAGLGGLEARRGHLSAGERLNRESLAMYREVGAPFAVSFGLNSLAANLSLQGRRTEALALLGEALAIYDRYPNRIGTWFMLNALSDNHKALGDRAKAWADAERSYALAKDLGHAIYVSGSAHRLAALAAADGDHRRAYALATEAAELTSKAARQKLGDRMVRLIQRFEQEGARRQIEALTRSNEQQAARLRQRELQQRWLWTVLAGVVMLLGAAALFVHRLRRSQRELRALNEQLQRSEADVRALNLGLEKRVEERTAELRQRKAYLRTLIDVLPMWAWFKDTQGRYLVVSQAHAHAHGCSVEDMEGKSDRELLPAPEAAIEHADDDAVMSTRQRKTAEHCVHADGVDTWLETYRAPVLDHDGTVLGTVGAAHDISERKAAEAAREAALAEARDLARQRSAFVAQMSHELRTPLNGILGFAQILQRDGRLTERQSRGLKIIDESGRHLLALINDLLDLARIDAAKLDLYPVDLDLQSFLQVVGDIVRVKADEKDVLFALEAAPDLPRMVRADEKRLRQVLLNLLSNAIKFTDAGQVTLRVARIQAAPATDLAPATARLHFEVEDHGVGMSDDEVARLFEPFEQVGDARRREGGTGLGLAISRRLVQLMGGDIHLRSRPGEGSTFWFDVELPTPEVQVRATPLLRSPTGYEGRRRRILIVDDVPQNRAMLCDSVEILGFEVAQAGNGREALDMVQQQARPDLVLMDITMPVMGGIEATRRLRQSPENARLPVIAMSASSGPKAEASSLQAGADAFVGKPIDQLLLLGTIGALLDLRWTFDDRAGPG